MTIKATDANELSKGMLISVEDLRCVLNATVILFEVLQLKPFR